MKYLFFILAIAFCFQVQAQQRLIKFTKTNERHNCPQYGRCGFHFPVSTSQSTLVLGPSAHTVDVNEAVDTIINRSYGAFARQPRFIPVSVAHLPERLEYPRRILVI